MGKISPACKAAAKKKFEVWPSAYASGWGVRCTINKLYGGDVTCSKVKKLKSRKEATKRDVQLANWFINMQNCGHGKRKA